MKTEKRLEISLLALRVTVALVMLVGTWTNSSTRSTPPRCMRVSIYWAACLALYLLRDRDVLFTVGK